jgi:pyruvate carboxylase
MDIAKYYKLTIDDTDYETKLTKKFAVRKDYTPKDPKKLYSIIPGTIQDIFVKSGFQVGIGEPLLILEAMKMQNSINSHLTGTIKAIHVKSGEKVPKNHLLLEFE